MSKVLYTTLTTDELIDPVFVYEYDLEKTANGSVILAVLASELKEAGISSGSVGSDENNIFLSFTVELDNDVHARLDAVIANHQGNGDPLVVSKQKKLLSIKAKTNSLIDVGSFEYPPASGKLFGLSQVSQLNITGAFNSRNEIGFVYPVTFFTKNDQDSVSLVDAVAIEAFHAAIVTTIRIILEGGAALKAQINAATIVNQVDAIVDGR